MSYAMIALIINITFTLMLVVGFFIGFWRGLKRSSVNLIFALVGAVVAFFTTTLVTNAILNIQVSSGETTKTLGKMFVDEIMNIEQVKSLIESAPNLQPLIEGLPAALFNVVVFLLMMMAVQFVIYIIYKIIAVAFLRDKKNPDGSKPKKHRLFGGLVGAVKTLVIGIFVFMPFTSLCGLAGTLMTEGDYFIETPSASTMAEEIDNTLPDNSDLTTGNIITNNLPQEAVDTLNAFNNSAFGFLGGVFGLDDALFDYYAQVEIEGTKVKIRSEIDSYWRIYDAYNQISKIGSEGFDKNFSNINFEKIDPIVNKVLESGIYKTVAVDLLTDIIKNYDNNQFIKPEDLGEFVDILDAVRKSLNDNIDMHKYLTHDILDIYEVIKSFSQNGVIDQINTLQDKSLANIIKVLAKDENFEVFQTGLVKIFDMNILRAGAEPFANIVMGMMVEGEKVSANTKLWTDETWDGVAKNLAGAMRSAQKLMDEVELDAILNDPLVLLNKNNEYNLNSIFTNLGSMVDLLRTNPLFVNAEGEPIIEKLLEDNKFTLPEQQIKDVNGELKTVESYTNLFKDIYLPSMELLRESGMYDLLKDNTIQVVEIFEFMAKESVKDEKFLSKVILPLYQVEPTKSLLVEGLIKGLEGGQINFNELTTYELWEDDLTQLSTILTRLQGMPVNDTTALRVLFAENGPENLVLALDSEKLSSIVEPMLLAKSTQNLANQLLTLATNAINNLLTNANLSIDLSKVQDLGLQANQVADVIGSFVDVYKDYKDKTSSGEAVKLENLDLTHVGNMLDIMKENAYSEGGVFNETFTVMTNYLQEKFPTVVQPGGDGTYKDVNFVELLQGLQG